MKRWYRIIYCIQWLEDCGAGEFEIADVFAEEETYNEVMRWFEDFKEMFESEYKVKILTRKIEEI